MKSSGMNYLMTDDRARDVFEFVARRRKVEFIDIVKFFSDMNVEETKSTLERLEGLELLSSTPASIDELSTWFVTRSGLTTERELKRYGAS